MPAAPRSMGPQRRSSSGGNAPDRRLTSVLRDQVDESSTSDYEVGAQRERNYRYYTLQEIGNEIDGRSKYVSPDVLDVVESKKAYFKEVFLSARQPIRFTADDSAAVPGQAQLMADQRTAYVRKQLRLNHYSQLFRDAWHDAFVAKRCVILAEWKEDTEDYTQKIEAVPLMQLQQQLVSDPNIVDVDVQGLEQFIDNNTGMVLARGSMTLTRDVSRVNLTLLQPERYYRDPNVAYVQDGMYAGYEEDVPRALLIEEGYDKEQVERLKTEYVMGGPYEEDNARKSHDSSWSRRRLHNRPKETETITVRRTWTYLDLSNYFDVGETADDGLNLEMLRLWEIHWCDSEILTKDGQPCIYPADEIPMFEWTEHKISHADHGLSTSDIVAHTQKTNSTLKRLIIDNQQMRNTSRYEAVAGQIKNPRELLDNNIGGVVWSRKLGSVAPLAAPEISPLSLNVIEMLDQDKEERSGVSRLAQGLNTDVIRYQNAADMVEKLTVNANRRITQAARDFADNFYIPLAKYVFKLGVRNDERTHILEAGGQKMPVRPADWDETEAEMSVHVALTPEESVRYAQSLLMMHTAQSQDPQLAMLYGIEQRHALFDEVYDALGVADSSRFLMRPDDQRFIQLSQMQMAEMQEQKQMQKQLATLQAGIVQSEDARQWRRLSLEGMKVQIDAADRLEDNEREDAKFEHEKLVDYAEIKLEREQKRGVAV